MSFFLSLLLFERVAGRRRSRIPQRHVTMRRMKHLEVMDCAERAWKRQRERAGKTMMMLLPPGDALSSTTTSINLSLAFFFLVLTEAPPMSAVAKSPSPPGVISVWERGGMKKTR